jgi:hypothetical protein
MFIIVVYNGTSIKGIYKYTRPIIVHKCPKVEFWKPLIASKKVFNPTSFTRKLVQIGAVVINIRTDL